MMATHPHFRDGTPVEVIPIMPTGLAVGSIVLGWAFNLKPTSWDDRRPYSIEGGPYTVTDITDGMVRAKNRAGLHSTLTSVREKVWLFIWSEGPAPDDRFPHKCPLCQQVAYVGLQRISHAVVNGCRDR